MSRPKENRPPVDRLEALLRHFSVSAHAFQAGALFGVNILDSDGVQGRLLLVRSGEVEVRQDGGAVLEIQTPSLLLYPRPTSLRLATDRKRGAEFVCANLAFAGGAANPITAALPAVVCLPLASLQAEPVLDLLFTEANARHCGRQAMLDSLFEVVLIQVFRQLMENGQKRVGMLAGLNDQRLRRAIVAIHEAPEKDWSLEALADAAGMSRSVFANEFRDVVGVTPGTYLQNWRIGLAQKALLQGKSIKHIAQDVGYGSEAALSRAFKASAGQSPREWRKAREAAAA